MAAGCALRWSSRTRISSGCRTSAFRRCTSCSTPKTDIVCERAFLPPKTELADQLASGTPLVTRRVANAGCRLRRSRVLGVLRVGLHQRADAAAVGGAAGAGRGAQRTASPRGHRRRGDVRESGAAGAVCRRHRRRRGRGRWCLRCCTHFRQRPIAPICCSGSPGPAVSTFRRFTT